MKSKSATWWGVFYIGAPYGINENGELVSKHRWEEAAREARAKLQDSPKYYGNNSTVRKIVKQINCTKEK